MPVTRQGRASTECSLCRARMCHSRVLQRLHRTPLQERPVPQELLGRLEPQVLPDLGAMGVPGLEAPVGTEEPVQPQAAEPVRSVLADLRPRAEAPAAAAVLAVLEDSSP